MTILIVGAGPAGLAAADAASATGAHVLVLDEQHGAGGQIWRGQHPAPARALVEQLRARAQVEFLHGARVLGLVGERLLVDTPAGPRELAWSRLILCTGARELLLPFPGWTLPGVTGAGGLQALVKDGLGLAGERVVVAGTGPLLLASAASARAAGASVSHIAEHRGVPALARFALRLWRHPGRLAQAASLRAQLARTRYLAGAQVLEALGDTRLRAVRLSVRGRALTVACDWLAAGFGLVPNTELARLLGCRVAGGAVATDALQRSTRAGVFAAGECAGIGGVDKALAEGRIAGLAAAGAPVGDAERWHRTRALAFGKLVARSFAPAPSLRAMCTPATVVCRCEDVRAAALTAHGDWRGAKLQTRLGMGPCQGRVCGSACEFLYGWDAPPARQPIFPTTAATLASVAAHEDDQ